MGVFKKAFQSFPNSFSSDIAIGLGKLSTGSEKVCNSSPIHLNGLHTLLINKDGKDCFTNV